jgi:hypothetical protein
LVVTLAGCAVDDAQEDLSSLTDSLDGPAALAARFAPVVYFDQLVPGGSGLQSKCLPESAEPYYQKHKQGDLGRVCNQDVSSLPDQPAYYDIAYVNDSTFITYWFFYGFQSSCFGDLGAHDADWERVTVRVAGGQLRDVVYFQHDGRYTRRADTIQVEGEHPVVYSGKNAHGSYHNSGGSGGCLYFEDFRVPGARNLKWETWHRLIDTTSGVESWMNASTQDDGLWGAAAPPPVHRGRSVDDTVCRTKAGGGTNTCIAGDYRDDHLPIRDLASPPFRHPDCASPTSTTCGGARACFFTDSDGQGASACYPAGEYAWVGSDLNDVYSSVRLFGGAAAVVYENAGFGGGTQTLTADVTNFKDIGFNDIVSSLRVSVP